MGLYDRDYMRDKEAGRPSGQRGSSSSRGQQAIEIDWKIITAGFAFIAFAVYLFRERPDPYSSYHEEMLEHLEYLDGTAEWEELTRKWEEPLGSFELTSGTLIATDPTYPVEAHRPGLTADITGCPNGQWHAHSVLKTFGEGITYHAELVALHESVGDRGGLVWEMQESSLGVDSGLLGLFDRASYAPLGIHGESKSPTDLSGVTSTAGKGDGSYRYLLARNQEGEVVGIQIVFVDDEGRG